MTLRARLLLALMAVALIPTFIFTLFTLDQLNRAMGRWYRPGVDRALESALEITKHSMTRLDAMMLAQSSERAASWPGTPVPDPRRAGIATSLRSSALDFVQIYR